jgi:hypothetical protein
LAILALILGICVVSWTTEPAYGQGTGIVHGVILCGSKSGCGLVAYWHPIDVAGSVRAHTTSGPGIDVNVTFTAADHGAFQLVLPSAIYDLYGAAVGYQTALLGVLTVLPGATIDARYSLVPFPGSGCVPVPEFGAPIITAFMALVSLTATILVMRKMHH